MSYKFGYLIRHQWFTLHLSQKISNNSHEIKFNICPKIALKHILFLCWWIAWDIWKLCDITKLDTHNIFQSQIVWKDAGRLWYDQWPWVPYNRKAWRSWCCSSQKEWKSYPECYDCNITFHKSLENTKQRKTFLPCLWSTSSCRCRNRCSLSRYSWKDLEGRLHTESSWLRINKCFFNTLKRQKLRSMEDNNKNVSLTTSHGKLIQYQERCHQAFKLLVKSQMQKAPLEFDTLMGYSLLPVSHCLGTADGFFAKTNKAFNNAFHDGRSQRSGGVSKRLHVHTRR